MPARKAMIYAHLAMAAFFLPLMLMMPLSGAFYLWGFQGGQETSEAFRVAGTPPDDEAAREEYFRGIFRREAPGFDFEYIRGSGKDFIFRPTTRLHYVATKNGDDLVFSKVEPSPLKRMIELHKGHGPRVMRVYESLFGVFLILVTLSGLWLAWTVAPYRKVTLVSFALGAGVIGLCFL